MGRDIHVRILARDKDAGNWKQVKLYKKVSGKFRYVDVYPGRNYKLFDILTGCEDDNFPAGFIAEKDLPPHLRQEVKKYKNISGYYDFHETNLADIKLYLIQHPKIRDYDYEENDPKAWKDNPVKYFIEQIESYVTLADTFWGFVFNSDIRIIYWFDN